MKIWMNFMKQNENTSLFSRYNIGTLFGLPLKEMYIFGKNEISPFKWCGF